MDPASWNKSLVFAHIESDWWHEMVSALEEELGSNNVVTTDDGTDVLQALTNQKVRPRMVVAGPPLRNMGALEAICQAAAMNTEARPCPIGLICDVRSDIEFLELLTKRGINLLLFYNDPVAETVARVVKTYFSNVRSNSRFDCSIDGTLEIDGVPIRVILRNVSTGGGLVSVARADGSKLSPSIGLKGVLSCDADGNALTTTVEVRQIFTRKRFLRSSISLGMQFHPSGFEETKQVEDFVAKIRSQAVFKNSWEAS